MNAHEGKKRGSRVASGRNERGRVEERLPWLNQKERERDDPRRDGELSANWRDPAFSTACPFPFARKHRCTSFSLSLPFQLPFFLPKPFCSTPSLSLSLARSLCSSKGLSTVLSLASFVRSGGRCRATPSGKISSQVSSDTRGSLIVAGHLRGSWPASSSLRDDTRVLLRR